MQRVTTGYQTARRNARSEGKGYFTRDGRVIAVVADPSGRLVETDVGPVRPAALDDFFTTTEPDEGGAWGGEVAA